MKTEFTYWQDGNFYIGYLNEYSEYETQGKTLDELKENLTDLGIDAERLAASVPTQERGNDEAVLFPEPQSIRCA